MTVRLAFPHVGCAEWSSRSHATMTQTAPTSHHTNRLIGEKSPYLLQHAHNPVDWYPWGEEALAKAKREDKPIFLSIGYSTCHWCHVMERESFEDPDIARRLNESFVCIKVDREEHPDLDQVYMTAVTRLSGQGGWPLTAFLTPDLKPFFGGTYFPPTRRWNLPGMSELLPAIAAAWKHQRGAILSSSQQLIDSLKESLAQTALPAPLTLESLHAAFHHAVRTFDESNGGFTDAPKFPRPHELSFLLAYRARTGASQALDMVTTTLDHLAQGGIHDHLGGGFHRYATDARWLVPHFEKMLYDQALLARAYLEAYRVTKRDAYARIARGIFDYVLRDLRDPRGGFYAAEDADSEGEEGKFYLWTTQQLVEALGPEEAEAFSRCYGATILHVEQPLEPCAERLAKSRAILFRARQARVRPHRDDKILTSWNGLMIASLAYAGATLDEPRYLQAAEDAATFLLATLFQDGTLLRRWRDGEARYPGTLEDYAFLSYGLFELYQAGFDPRRLTQARQLLELMIQRFWDEPGGGFFLRASDEPALIVRSKDAYDGAIPSGNSIAALALLKVGRLSADARLETFGRRTLDAFATTLAREPIGSAQMLMAADVALGPTQEIVIAGEPASPATRQMLRVVHERFLPRALTVLHPEGTAGAAIEALAPYTTAQGPIGGQPAAYVCEQFVCQWPVTTAEALSRLLDQR